MSFIASYSNTFLNHNYFKNTQFLYNLAASLRFFDENFNF